MKYREKKNYQFVIAIILLITMIMSIFPYRGTNTKILSSVNNSASRLSSINKRLIEDPKLLEDKYFKDDAFRYYDIRDIEVSAKMNDDPELSLKFQKDLYERHEVVKSACEKDEYTSSGGWCLTKEPKKEVNSPDVVYPDVTFPMAFHHATADKGMVKVLKQFIKDENITSINDFGAGIGQYGSEIIPAFPHMHFNAYDGAGNVEEYTKGKVKFFDLTMPFAFPKADWVLSLEVGEHIPTKFEAMVIRNLHAHNCKGVILSWAILGQFGHGHINNHSNKYLELVFNKLGYTNDVEIANKLRESATHRWFQKSVMVFRRNRPVC